MVMDGKALAFNAGDSRIYKISKTGIDYISHDHSLVQDLVDKSFIQQDAAAHHPLKTLLISVSARYLRANGKISAFIFLKNPLPENACYLLCSDGVNDLMSDRGNI